MASTATTPEGDFADDNFTQEGQPAPSVASSHPSQSYPHPPGASVYTPTATPSSQLNPRSCVTCRRRKVRCDKHMPCSNCRRAQISCIFPAPGRAPRRPRPKDPNAPPKQPSSEREIELMKRLRKLEGIVEELSGQIELETARNHSSSGGSPEAPNTGSDTLVGSGGSNERAASVGVGSNASQNSPSALGRVNSDSFGPGRLVSGQSSSFGPLQRTPSDVHKRFGRLVINDHGKTRYVSSAFWSRITDELDELRAETQRLTDEDTDVSDDESSPATAAEQGPGDHHAFIFGYRSADVDLRALHPLPSQIPYIWQVFQENVDPLVKILHIPTVNKMIRDIRNNLDSMTPATEALMFSIYYSAITSLDDDDVKLNFGVDKPALISQYRFALEQALAKAGFLTSSDIVVLQAFVLFLVLVRRHDDTRFAWTLTGLAIRIAQSLGLHRDGTEFPGLTPFEVEMRRRLFWAIIVLDLRSAEDQGTDLTIIDRTYDTKFPMNINDSDFDPEATEFPQEREGPTDMTFCLIRYEICALARRLHTVSSALAPVCPKDHASTIEERERMIREVYNRVEAKYLKGAATDSNPMYWTAAQIARVIVAKMILIIYQPVIFPGPNDANLSNEIRSRLFDASIEIFEYNHLLNTDPRCRQWRWLFQTYTQWHAVAYILMEVTKRPWGPTVERAWTALNSAFTIPNPLEFDRIDGRSAVWVPFRKLWLKAKRHRDAEIARLSSDPAAAQALELEDRVTIVPTNFAVMSGLVKSAVANERWRKMVNAPPLPPGAVEKRESELNAQAAARSQPDATTMPPTTAMARTPSAAPNSALEFIDQAMAQPSFEPENFWPIALSNDFAHDARQAIFGFMGGDIPRQDNTLANYSHGNTQSSNDARMNPLAQSQPQQSPTPLVDAVKNTNPPPWLWGENSVPQTGTAGLSNVQLDDVDINMDDDFNWQDWSQSIPGGGFWSGQPL